MRKRINLGLSVVAVVSFGVSCLALAGCGPKQDDASTAPPKDAVAAPADATTPNGGAPAAANVPVPGVSFKTVKKQQVAPAPP